MISKPSINMIKYFSLVAIIASFLTITYTILKPNKVPSWTSAGVGSITFQTSTHNFNSAPWTVSFNTLAETFEKRTSRRTAAFLTKRAQELEATSNAMWTNKTIIIGKLPATPVWFLKQGSSHFGTLNSMKKVQRPKRMIGDDRDNWWSPSACNIPCVFTDATSQMLLDKKGQEKFQVNGFVQMLEDTGRVKNRALHPQHNLNGSINKDWLDGSEKKEETTKTSFRSSRMIKLKNRKNNKNQSNYNQGKNLLPVISITWEAIVPINYLNVGVPSSIYAGKFKATGGYLVDSDIYTSYGYHFLRQPWISHQWNLGNEQQFNDLMPILAVVMSHCVNWRMDYLNKLSKWFPVHFLGKCGQRPEMIEMPDGVEFDEHGRLKNIEMVSNSCALEYSHYCICFNSSLFSFIKNKH